MIPNFDLAAFNHQIQSWLELMEQAQSEPMAPEARQQLAQAVEQVRRGHEMINANYAKEATKFRNEMAALERMNAATLAEAEAVEKQLAEFKIPEPPPVPGPKPIDPQLGFVLGREFLERYAPKTVRAQPVQPEVQDFSAEYTASGESPAPQTSPVIAAAVELSPNVVAGLLQLARITSTDIVYHLGCGDGRLLVSAAGRFHAKCVGVDRQRALIDTAHENIRKARLQPLINVKVADPHQEDCGRATVVVLSLGPQANEAVALALSRQLQSGARIVTAEGPFKTWKADQASAVEEAGTTYRLHLWHIQKAERGNDSIGTSGSVWEED